MINYFRELLCTMKKIERHLSDISRCTYDGYHGNRKISYIKTKEQVDKY